MQISAITASFSTKIDRCHPQLPKTCSIKQIQTLRPIYSHQMDRASTAIAKTGYCSLMAIDSIASTIPTHLLLLMSIAVLTHPAPKNETHARILNKEMTAMELI